MFLKLNYMEMLCNVPKKWLLIYFSVENKKIFLAIRNQSFPQLRTAQCLFLSSVGVERK